MNKTSQRGMQAATLSFAPISTPESRRPTCSSGMKLLSSAWLLVRPMRWLMIGSLGLMVIGRGAGLILPISVKYLVDDVLMKRHVQSLYNIMGAVAIATIVQSVAAYFVTHSLSKASFRLISDLRIQLQTHISKLPVDYFDSHRTGNLVSRVMNDVEGVRNLAGTGMIEFAGGLLTAVFAFAALMLISVKITLIAISIMAAYGLAQRGLLRVRIPKAIERAQITSEITGRLTESFAGIRVVKAYGAEARETAVFEKGVKRLVDNILEAINQTSLMAMASTMLIGVMAIVIMFMGVWEILAGRLTLANYLTMNVLLAFVVSPITQAVGVGTQFADALGGLNRSVEALNELTEEDDPCRTVVLERQRVQGNISFRGVSFAYSSGSEVLHNVSFDATPGSVTALVGSSGSGKSTIIGLTCGFYNPTGGAIFLDGVDLSRIELKTYRSALGVVFQESFLFDGTIRENITFARPDASQAEILEAVRIARVDEFTNRLPEGLDTIVGERGVKLSGGQRQRTSIARAILANPRILILDEATSSLDSESEAMIQEALSYLVKGRTTFVIAHRLSTIHRADQILVVEDGRIVERGTHSRLFSKRGRYFDLYTRQQQLERNLFVAPGEGGEGESEHIHAEV